MTILFSAAEVKAGSEYALHPRSETYSAQVESIEAAIALARKLKVCCFETEDGVFYGENERGFVKVSEVEG